jgi:hypothetical protein
MAFISSVVKSAGIVVSCFSVGNATALEAANVRASVSHAARDAAKPWSDLHVYVGYN